MTQAIVKCYLLGSFTITVDDAPVSLPKTKDAQRLLAYLLLNRHQTYLRSFLIGLFWPDAPESHARRLLTRALGYIRHQTPFDTLVHADVNAIWLVRTDNMWVDYHQFHELVTPHLQNIASNSTGSNRNEAEVLTEAVALYKGDLLPGLYDDWLLTAQRRTEEFCRDSLMRLTDIHKRRGHYQAALHHTLRLGEIDPLNEANQREIIRLYIALAQPQAAKEQFQIYRRYLQSEMDVEPEAETKALVQQLQWYPHAGQNHAAEVELPQRPHPLPPLVGDGKRESYSGALSHLPLIGRDAERQQLWTHLNQLFDDELTNEGLGAGGIILVGGEAGVGKTRLVQTVVQDFAWRGAQVVWHDAIIDAPNMPYAPYIYVLEAGLTELKTRQLANLIEQQWLRDISPLLPQVGQWLSDSQPTSFHSLQLTQQRFIEAYAQILLRWSELDPLIIVFDNLDQWTVDCLYVLHQLIDHMMEAPLVVIGLYRNDIIQQKEAIWHHLQQLATTHSFMQMTVLPLTQQATTALARAALGTVTPMVNLEAYLYEETAGNPLFVLELLSSLHQKQQLIYGQDNQWQTLLDTPDAESDAESDAGAVTPSDAKHPIPVTIKSLLMQKVEQYTADEQSVLNCAAIWGIRFDLSRMIKLAARPDEIVLAALTRFEQFGLIIAHEQSYLFRQGFFRQAVYESIDRQKHSELHRRALQLLICENDTTNSITSVTLLHHAVQGGLWAEAIGYGMQAAAEVKSTSAYQTALDYLTQTRELLHTHTPFDHDEQLRLDAEILAEQQVLESAMRPTLQNNDETKTAPRSLTDETKTEVDEQFERQTVYLAKITAPAFGRSLHDDEQTQVVWTLNHPQDEPIGIIEGKKSLRQYRLIRLVHEAEAQGAVPTIDQLASALQVSNKTIYRDLQNLRQQDIKLITRGTQKV